MFQSGAAVLAVLETPPLKCEMLKARLPSYEEIHSPYLTAFRCALCSSNPFGCWLSSALVQLSLDFGFGVRVGTTVHLPNKRCRKCKGDVPTPPASITSTAAASGEQIGGLAWELQKRIGEPCLQPLMFCLHSSPATAPARTGAQLAKVCMPKSAGLDTASCILSNVQHPTIS